MKRQGSNSCEEVKRLLPSYSAGTISACDQLLVEEHLADCADCEAELVALDRVGVLLEQTPLEPAPDLWYAIKPNLAPRQWGFRIDDLIAWFARHRFQSAAAAVATTMAVGAWLLVAPQPNTEAEGRAYIAQHASLTWREPFADKVGLGLADAPYAEAPAEEAH